MRKTRIQSRAPGVPLGPGPNAEAEVHGYQTIGSQLNLLDLWYIATTAKPFGQKGNGTPWTTPDCVSCNKK